MEHIPSKNYSRFKKIQKMLLREFLQNLNKNDTIPKVNGSKNNGSAYEKRTTNGPT